MQGLLVSYAPLFYLVDNQKYQFMKQNCRSISVYVDRRNGLSYVVCPSVCSDAVRYVFHEGAMACHSSYFSYKGIMFSVHRRLVGYVHAVSPRRPDEGLGLTSPSGCQGLSGQPFRAGRGVVVARSQARQAGESCVGNLNPCPSRHGGSGRRHRLRRSAPH